MMGAAGTWGVRAGWGWRGRHGERERQSPHPGQFQPHPYISVSRVGGDGAGVVDTAVFALSSLAGRMHFPFVAADLEKGGAGTGKQGPVPSL